MAQLQNSTIQGDLAITGQISCENIEINGIEPVDYIIEQGTSGIWRYRKYNSGIAELWGKSAAYTVSISNPWGSVYSYDNAVPPQTYPFTFVEYPYVQITPETDGNNFWTFTGSGGSTSQTPGMSVVRPNSNSATVRAIFYVVGRWK